MLLSGLRATLIMEDGATLDKDKVAASLEAQGLGMASFSQADLPVPEAAYTLTVSGVG